MLELGRALGGSYSVGTVDFAGCASLDEMVAKVQERCAEGPCVLVGFSMGGWVAQVVAARSPEKVSALVLVSSWTVAPASYLATVHELHEEIRGGRPLSALRAVVREGFAQSTHADALADRWLVMAERVGVETFLAETSAILAHPHVEQEARGLDCPTLALAGAADALLPVESQKSDAGLISQAAFQVVAGAGHNLVWEQPAVVGALVGDWLDRSRL